MTTAKTLSLLVLVVGIWGLVGYKLYQHVTSEPNVRTYTKRKNVVDTISVETRTLSLAYADPFLPHRKQRTPAVSARTSSDRSVQQVTGNKQTAEVPVAWHRLQYIGYQYNVTKRLAMATVQLDAQDHFVKEGGALENFQILSIYPDSLKVLSGKQVKFIKRLKSKE